MTAEVQVFEQITQIVMNYGALGAICVYMMTRNERILKENTDANRKNAESNKQLADLIQSLIARGFRND